MKIEQVAAQLYTLHGLTKNRVQIADALVRVRAMGYEAVQISGMGPLEEPLDDKDLAHIVRDAGMTICATHEPSQQILENPEQVVERLQTLGTQFTAYPYPGGIDFSNQTATTDFIVKLNRAGQILGEAGCTLCYHNHAIEFRKLNGKTILDLIFEETNPQYLQGELDTYWVQNGGGDPVAWCKKLQNRLPLLHLKDYAVSDENQPIYTSIGAGNLNFPAIIEAAEESGCRWFIVERDPAPGDPFESLEQSFNYIRDNLCQPI